jgi:hypothetical protein
LAAAVGSEQRDARSDFINQRDRFWFAFCSKVAPIAFVIAGSGESGVVDSRPKTRGDSNF